MTTDPTLRALVANIRTFPQLSGCEIGFHGNGSSRLLAPGLSTSAASVAVGIIIEGVPLADPATNGQTARLAAGSAATAAIKPPILNKSRVNAELKGAGMSCTFALVSAVGVVGGLLSEAPSAGTSTFLVVAAWGGFLSSGVACINGLARVREVVVRPDDNSIERWENDSDYTLWMNVADAIGIASGVAGLPSSIRGVFAAASRQRAFLARGLSFGSLKAMNRVERAKALSAVVQEAARTPEGRLAITQATKEAQIGARALQSGVSIRQAEKLGRVLSDETIHRLLATSRDALLFGASCGASVSSSERLGAASGSLNLGYNYVIHLMDPGRGS
jgi:hypothetical protein